MNVQVCVADKQLVEYLKRLGRNAVNYAVYRRLLPLLSSWRSLGMYGKAYLSAGMSCWPHEWTVHIHLPLSSPQVLVSIGYTLCAGHAPHHPCSGGREGQLNW